MSRVLVVVIGGLFLAGCAIPVPLQIASWALDGFSLLATNKSVTDHGISMVAQQDCALWRGVTEGAVCREDDPMAIIAERGDVVGDDGQVQTRSSLISIQTAPKSSRAALEQSVQSSWVVDQEVASDVTAPAVLSEDASGRVSELTAEAVDENQALQWQLISEETASVAPGADGMASYNAMPGDYFVVGSFGVWDNAKRFAAKHPVLGAQRLAANVADYRVFRIVVGPYNEGNQATLRQNIKDADIEDIWAVRVPADEITLAWRTSVSLTELASISVSD